MEVREPSARYACRPQRVMTELGELPVDWKVASLDALDPVVTSGSRGWAAYYAESGAIFLRITNLSRSRIYPSVDDLKYVVIPEDNSEGARTALQIGDVLISITADIGMIGWVSPTLSLPAYVNQHIALVRVPSERANSRYLAYFLAGAASQRRFKALTDAGAKAGMSLAGVRQQVLVALPSPEDQQAISEALSDADALIESLSRLLAKKRQIKQGAMRELLTGKRRLPGFRDPWGCAKIGDFTDCTAGGTPSTNIETYWGGDIPWMSSGELNLKQVHGVERRITEAGLKNSSTKWLPTGCVLVGLAGQGKTRGTVAMNRIPLCTNQSIAAIFPVSSFDSEFLYFNLESRYEELRELSAGDGGRGGLNLQLIRNLEVPAPHLTEQRAIAQVLTDLDLDIAAVEGRLAKARDIKQGMMQALLTGRIRLTQPTPSTVAVPA